MARWLVTDLGLGPCTTTWNVYEPWDLAVTKSLTSLSSWVVTPLGIGCPLLTEVTISVDSPGNWLPTVDRAYYLCGPPLGWSRLVWLLVETITDYLITIWCGDAITAWPDHLIPGCLSTWLLDYWFLVTILTDGHSWNQLILIVWNLDRLDTAAWSAI